MIARIFNTNQAYIFAFIPLMVLAFRWPTLFSPAPFTPSGQLPFMSDFFAWLSNHSWLSLLLTMAAISSQAYWISWTANEHRLLPYVSNFPAFILVLCYSVLSPQSWFSPVIFANVFLVLALKRTADIYHQGEINSHLFRAGIYISLASVLYLPALFMLPILYYDLAVIRPFKWREYIMPLTGVATVYFWLFTWFYLRSESDIFFNYFLEPKTFLMMVQWKFFNWLPAIMLMLLAVVSLAHLAFTSQKRTVRKNNLYKVVIATLAVTSVLTAIFNRDLLSVSGLIWPSLSVVLANYLLGLSRNWIREGWIYALTVAILLREILFFF